MEALVGEVGGLDMYRTEIVALVGLAVPMYIPNNYKCLRANE